MSSPPITGDQRLVKHINRMALLRLLREEAGLSRADLSERSGLTRSTVSLLVKELIEEGWLIEAHTAATGALGRRPTPLSFDDTRIALIGADLGPDAIRVVVTSIGGEVRESTQASLRSKDPDAACLQLVGLVTDFAAKVTRSGARLLGIGVGLHGAVDKRSGSLEFAPNIGWRNVEVGRRLGAALSRAGLGQVPVYYQNEADLAAVGESEFGDRPVDDPLVFISCGIGVGAGIILGDALFTGATGSAGEIGHTTLVIDGKECFCGRLGCAEAYIGLKSIAAAADCLHNHAIDRRALRSRISARDPMTCEAFAQAGAALGVLLQNVWTTFNPQAIILGGETIDFGGEHLLNSTSQVLSSYSRRAGLAAPQVRPSRYADLATAVGGAAYVLHAILNPHQPALHTPYAFSDS